MLLGFEAPVFLVYLVATVVVTVVGAAVMVARELHREFPHHTS